jgi:hypothetical protein
LADGAESGLGGAIGRGGKGDDGAVMVVIRRAVEDGGSGGSNGIGDSLDFRGIAAFRKIGDTFDQRRVHLKLS